MRLPTGGPLALLLLALGAVLVLAACSPSRSAPPEHPVVENPELAGKRTVYREEFDPPRPAPSFRLIDQDGEPLSLEDLRGKVVVLSFVYTRCPDVCPLVMSQYLAIQRGLGDLVDDSVALVFVSTDPEWDTPDRLRQFTRSLGGRWHFLTGEREAVAEVWREYDIYVTVNPQDIVQHSYKIFVIDGQGMLRILYGGFHSPEAIIEDVRAIVEG